MNFTACISFMLVGLMLAGCIVPCRCSESIAIEGIIAPGATLQEISTAFKFTEGPAADINGNVYFTDQPNNRIMRYTTDGRMETFMQPAGRANGLYFANDGKLLACADENSELWAIDAATKSHTVLAREYNHKRLNSTNDVWQRPDGGIYFTDPYYQRPWWSHKQLPQDGEHVYYLDPKTRQLVRVIDDMKQPNGIIGTRDGKTLYVADIRADQTFAYDIQPDGSLTGKRLFCEMGSDGMTIDCYGNVYLTGHGVTIFDASGRQIEHIDIPQPWTANVTFGGKNHNTLFITAGTGLYALQMNVCGVK